MTDHIETRNAKKFHNSLAFLLPFMAAIYPATVIFAENSRLLNISSWIKVTSVQAAIGLIVFLIYSLFNKNISFSSALAALVFIIFFNTYGFLYSSLIKQDLFQVTHTSLLPLYLFIIYFLTRRILNLKPDLSKNIWSVAIVVLFGLLLLNFVRIAVSEYSKAVKQNDGGIETELGIVPTRDGSRDIYYIVLDEFSGLQPMRDYWKNSVVDGFKDFLLNTGFQVSERSVSSSIDTLHQMSIRLNYRDYPLSKEYLETYYNDISNNRAMQFLKSRGYRTVVFDESRSSFAYPSKPAIIADISFDGAEYDTSGSIFDDYGIMVADNTIMVIFEKYYKVNNPNLVAHRNMIYLIVNKLGELREKDQPTFVFVHMLLPHMPFMFDANGGYVDPSNHQNWDYYLGNYNFSIGIAERMIKNILSQYPNDELPIIVLQSDHGARNKATTSLGSKILENFDEAYSFSILNGMYLPNCPEQVIPDNFNPVNTFTVIFECAFGDTAK